MCSTKLGVRAAPLLLGLILGPMMERTCAAPCCCRSARAFVEDRPPYSLPTSGARAWPMPIAGLGPGAPLSPPGPRAAGHTTSLCTMRGLPCPPYPQSFARESVSMKSRAAVAFKAGEPLQIIEIDVAPPQPGEVLIRITHTGVYHTDAFTLSGDDPEGIFPVVLGHEGAGIVVECGAGVTSVGPGDHVIPALHRRMRPMPVLQGGKTNLCTAVRATRARA